MLELEAGQLSTRKALLDSAAENQKQAAAFASQKASDVLHSAKMAQIEVRQMLPPATTSVLNMKIPRNTLDGLTLVDQQPKPLNNSHPSVSVSVGRNPTMVCMPNSSMAK